MMMIKIENETYLFEKVLMQSKLTEFKFKSY